MDSVLPETHLISSEIQNFLDERRSRQLSLNTIEFYSRELELARRWLAGQQIEDVESLTVARLRSYLTSLGDHRNPGGIHAAWRSLKAWLLWYEKEVEPDNWKNPIRKIPAPKVNLDPLEGVSLENFNKMAQSCAGRDFLNVRNRTILMFLLDTGLRRNEFLSLNIGDLNLDKGQVIVQCGKGGKKRVTFFGSKTRQMVHRYFRKRKDLQPTDPLWITIHNTRMEPAGLRQMVATVAKRAGVEPSPSLHDFRRTFAKTCLKNGMDVFTLQRLMGHSSLVVLLRYLRLTETDLEAEFNAHGPVDRAKIV